MNDKIQLWNHALNIAHTSRVLIRHSTLLISKSEIILKICIESLSATRDFRKKQLIKVWCWWHQFVCTKCTCNSFSEPEKISVFYSTMFRWKLDIFTFSSNLFWHAAFLCRISALKQPILLVKCMLQLLQGQTQNCKAMTEYGCRNQGCYGLELLWLNKKNKKHSSI